MAYVYAKFQSSIIDENVINKKKFNLPDTLQNIILTHWKKIKQKYWRLEKSVFKVCNRKIEWFFFIFLKD